MKRIISMMLAIVLVFSLSACSKNNTSSDVDSSTPTQVETFSAPENYASVLLVTINPQFKLYLDENNNVLAVEPVNDDAKTFSDEIDFENKSFESVIEIILEKANENGFIKENATVNFEITEQKAETVSKDDILQKAVAAAQEKATELKITITAEAKETEDNASSEETNTTSGNTSKPNNKKPSSATSTTTPDVDNSKSNNNNTETPSSNKPSSSNDSKTPSTPANCTHKDENKDNKCDLCSAKMDFGTAYKNGGFDGSLFSTITDRVYDSTGNNTVSIFLKNIYSVCVDNANAIKIDKDYFWTFYYSATEFENIAKSKFNIDDSVIVELRTLTDTYNYKQWDNAEAEEFIPTPIYDSDTNTYRWREGGYGGPSEEFIGYKKISDSEYIAYLGWEGDVSHAVKCTYNDTVKISSIERCDTKPSDLIKLNIPSYSTES